MKFIKLESRGGNYLVVAENVAWLRTAENGQTSVGIIGGQPLLVVGTVEEVAEKILTASSSEEQPVAAPPPAPAPVPVPEPAPAPAPAPEPVREVEIEKAVEKPPAERPRPIAVKTGMTLSERLAAGGTPRVKAGSQRFMGGLE
jgi:outer membrane biosynthesis protein TonB